MAHRALAKLELTRRLYERGYHRQEVLDLYRFIDWLLQLPEELEAQVWQQIVQFEEAQHVTYISTAERMGHQKGLQEGREQGRQQGRQEGLRQGLLDGLELALELKFGRAGLDLVPELRQIEDVAVLQAVAELLRTANTLDELRRIYATGEAE
jgi:flagellar biosynthesis/type III secretory pathway protein FliH